MKKFTKVLVRLYYEPLSKLTERHEPPFLPVDYNIKLR